MDIKQFEFWFEPGKEAALGSAIITRAVHDALAF
jgi:hypothetical protein